MRQFFRALDNQDYASLSALLADTYVLAGRRIGRQGAFDVIRQFYAAFPDYTHEVEEMIVEGNRVAVRVMYHGTHEGDFRGVAATGRSVTYVGVQTMTVVDGVITEGWFLDDDLDLLTQLGMTSCRSP